MSPLLLTLLMVYSITIFQNTKTGFETTCVFDLSPLLKEDDLLNKGLILFYWFLGPKSNLVQNYPEILLESNWNPACWLASHTTHTHTYYSHPHAYTNSFYCIYMYWWGLFSSGPLVLKSSNLILCLFSVHFSCIFAVLKYGVPHHSINHMNNLGMEK